MEKLKRDHLVDSNHRVKSVKTSMWWKHAVIYEVYVDKFFDTFNGLTQKLDYLTHLGINCIHILPHYPSPMIDDGYDVSDYLGVRDDLGTIEDFEKFIESAHEVGIKVIIDFVLNHTSTKHPWFIEASSSTNNKKRDFYLWSKTGKEYPEAPNLFPDLKDSNWVYNEKTEDYYFSTFHEAQADLNWNNTEVFAEMKKIMDFWVGKGVDGFRLDAASHLIKKEHTTSDGLPETHEVIKKIRFYLDGKYSNIILLAEVCDELEKTKKYFGDGDECHLIYNFPLVGQLLIALKNNRKVSQSFIDSLSGIPDNCSFVNFLGHHDEMALGIVSEKQRAGLFNYFDPEKKYRFANGIASRITTLLKGDTKKIITAFNMLLAVPGPFIIYYGYEVGMENEMLLLGVKDTRRILRGKFNWESAEVQKLDPNSFLNVISKIVKERV